MTLKRDHDDLTVLSDPRIVLLLQGGGALGSYQAGAYAALAEHNLDPKWVIGVSIGSINASIIAGNPPERRVERLKAFWDKVTEPTAGFGIIPFELPESFQKKVGAASSLAFGQPGFFRPRAPLEWAASPKPLSFYDTSQLKTTLLELVDFELINSGKVRLSVGAVQVSTGNLIYFDSAQTEIIPEHIMASGALPPGFPPVEIDGELFWDGGLVSNTPLEYMMSEEPRSDSLVFQVDLFPAVGEVPTSLDEVAEREKDIRYSSRTRAVTTKEKDRHDMRRQVHLFLNSLPEELREDASLDKIRELACPSKIHVAHLIYRPSTPQGSQKDFEFDRASANRRWAEGYSDAKTTVEAAPWDAPRASKIGMHTFDVIGDRIKQAVK